MKRKRADIGCVVYYITDVCDAGHDEPQHTPGPDVPERVTVHGATVCICSSANMFCGFPRAGKKRIKWYNNNFAPGNNVHVVVVVISSPEARKNYHSFGIVKIFKFEDDGAPFMTSDLAASFNPTTMTLMAHAGNRRRHAFCRHFFLMFFGNIFFRFWKVLIHFGSRIMMKKNINLIRGWRGERVLRVLLIVARLLFDVCQRGGTDRRGISFYYAEDVCSMELMTGSSF